MLFHSPTFAAFFLLTWALYQLPVGPPVRARLLLVASLVFYAAWYPAYLGLFLALAVTNHHVARRLEARRGQAAGRRLLVLAVACDLGVLAAFKYSGFLLQNLRSLAGWLPALASLPQVDPFLPLGISFFTFQLVAYLVDVWRGAVPASDSVGRTTLFLAFFPQLIAGPIVRARELMPQLDDLRPPPAGVVLAGLDRIFLGLFKKVVIADGLATFVDPLFAAPLGRGSLALGLGVYAYAVQIYCDFSGYTDIGIGCARALGVALPENFDAPYLSPSLDEFWRRWHVTLGTWLRDYLYVPLGGSRQGPTRTDRNLMVTMILGGLWHGAAWTFVIWGAMHGLGLVVLRALRRRRAGPSAPRRGLWRWAGVLATFHYFCLSLVLFRATDMATAGTYLFSLGAEPWLAADPRGVTSKFQLLVVAVTLAGCLVAHLVARRVASRVLATPEEEGRAERAPWRLEVLAAWGRDGARATAYAAALLACLLATRGGAEPFLYFQF